MTAIGLTIQSEAGWMNEQTNKQMNGQT